MSAIWCWKIAKCVAVLSLATSQQQSEVLGITLRHQKQTDLGLTAASSSTWPLAVRILLPSAFPTSADAEDPDYVLPIDKLFNATECIYDDRIHGYSRCVFEGLECEAENSACQRVALPHTTADKRPQTDYVLRCQCNDNYHYNSPASCVNSSTFYLMQAESASNDSSLVTQPSEQQVVDNATNLFLPSTTSAADQGTFSTAETTTAVSLPVPLTIQPKCGRSSVAGADPFGIANQTPPTFFQNWSANSKRAFADVNFTNENFIVGGQLADPGVICWQAGLQISVNDGRNHQFCGGTILGERWILTAGHCVVHGYVEEFFVQRRCFCPP